MKKYLFIAILCLTLGLAPFFPEPHIVGKIRWILGGAKGMQLIDWWDTILHGAPWVILFSYILRDIFVKLRKS
jgi:hypothetical protein